MVRETLLLVVVVAVVTVLATLLGAANLGTALAFGQIAFALALTGILLRR